MDMDIDICLVPFCAIQPGGLLTCLDAEGDPPDDDVDRMHIRDNLKLAQVRISLARIFFNSIHIYFVVFNFDYFNMMH